MSPDPRLSTLPPSAEQIRRARATAAAMARDLDLAERLAPWAAHAWRGAQAARPELHLDDFSGLTCLDGIAGVEAYQHRARLRAGDGDLFATVVPEVEGYEAYCRDRLGLGSPGRLQANGGGSPLAVAAACRRAPTFERIVAFARSRGGLDLHPFMGIEAVWELAAEVAAAAAVEVRVVAPPPPVTWLANDKASLGEIVRGVLGDDWLVETRLAADPDQLARALEELAARHRRVALKRLRCVSGMGNAAFDSASLGNGGGAVRDRVAEFLRGTSWDGAEPVLAVAWEETDCSPSTQLWIPPAGCGEPRLDGIYEQLLEGERRVFAGSRPTTLPEPVNRALAEGALAVAWALQGLGYVGRCSFDHLVVGDLDGDFRVRFVECNGRWGGTSLPMRLIDRVVRGPRPPYRAQDFVHPGLVGASFGDVLAALDRELFDPASGGGGFLLYNVGPLAAHGKLDVVSLGASQAEAEAGLAERLPRLLGL